MGDYDLQIIVIIIFSSILFSGFMYLYAQTPNIDYAPAGDYGQNWSEPQTAEGVKGAFDMVDVYGESGIWLVGLFVSAMGIIGGTIALRFLRG